MDASRFQRISELFEAARQMPVAQRDAFLIEQCAGDGDLLEQVRSLLEHHDKPGQALETPLVQTPLVSASLAGDLAGGRPAIAAPLPSRIGRYQIIRKIGEGGMGTVFEAQQENPRRTVALKVIHAGIASSGMLRRFEHEAQILGRLQHPGIAQIFEAGTFDSGVVGAGPQPFFAMELVDGVPLNEYAATHNLDARQRLELIARIGDAVQHAHQKGVIHRDLKPGNILVDASGQPKILDFGVARVTDADVQMTTMRTDIGQLIGTLPYMSPEQAAGDANALDTRSDVYALGVVAYELLSGRLPHDLHRRLAPEAVRIIRDEEPTRLSAINRTFRGDIETIVGKALEKDRARRYQTASDLSEDIRRYLRDEAVIARPPSRAYQFRKFAKRNKAVVIGVAAVFVALIAGVVGTSLALVRAMDAERIAVDRLALIEKEKTRAVAAERVAVDRLAQIEKEKAKVDAVSRFQLDMLNSVDPRIAASNRDVTVREVLDGAAKKIDEGSLKDQPEIEGAVQYMLGSTYFSLGLYPEATKRLQKSLDLRLQAFGPENLDVSESQSMLGEAYREAGDIKNAEPLARAALATRQKLKPGDSDIVAESLNNVALIEKANGNIDVCIDLNRQALAMRRKVLGNEHSDLMQSLNNLAMALMARRREPKEIDALFQEGIDLGRRLYNGDHLFTASLLQNQAELREATGDVPGALQSMQEALSMRRAVLGDEHAWVAESMNNLAGMLKRKGDFTAAEPLFRQSLDVRTKVYGPDDNRVSESLNNLANLLHSMGRPEDAEPLMRRALEIRRKNSTGDNAMVALYMANLGNMLTARFKLDEAESLIRDAIDMRRRLGDDKSVIYASSLLNLAAVMRDRSADALEQVESLQRQALEVMRNSQPLSPVQVAYAMNNLGITLRERGRLDEAETLEREALDIRRKAMGDDSAITASTMHNLGGVLYDKGQFAEAESLLRAALEVRRKKLAAGSAELVPTLTLLGMTLVKQSRPDEGEPLLREGLEIRVKVLPAGHVRIAESSLALGMCLTAQKKFEQAEPILLEACATMTQSPVTTLARKIEACEQVIALYEAWGRPEQSTQWRAKRDAVAGSTASAPAATTPATQP